MILTWDVRIMSKKQGKLNPDHLTEPRFSDRLLWGDARLKDQILCGDALEILRTLPDESVHCCVTSPPYWGLRDYGAEGQIGLEPTPEEYVAKLVEVFREVRRVLRNDGTLWLNLGDCYARDGAKGDNSGYGKHAEWCGANLHIHSRTIPRGLKPKDLVGIPWSVAKALQAPYYTGRIKDERDRVWLAAILDGEGTISGFRHQRKDDGRIRTGVNIFITNSSLAPLNRISEIWPASRHEHMMPSEGHLGTRPVYRWVVGNCQDKSDLLAEPYPYLVEKKLQALVAWNLLEYVKDAKRLGKSRQANEVRAKRDLLVDILHALNSGDDSVVLPDWLKEPPSLYEPGWYLRSDIIWAKSTSGRMRWGSCMPESVRDRPTRAHEYIFLLAKSECYYYDQDAIREPFATPPHAPRNKPRPGVLGRYGGGPGSPDPSGDPDRVWGNPKGRNKRTVWTVPTRPFKGAHFAVFPPDLIRPCILAGCPPGGIVLDPFFGAGTVGVVALEEGRHFIGIELNPEYCEMARERIEGVRDMQRVQEIPLL